uniref:E3 ubiquitin-protein ligase TRIM39-like isoform X2 n=1 Tax=Myxine glutinosa TaxID=7769 RepID=UPI00358EE1CA
MASSSSDMGDNLFALTCSVCLQIYREPVGLPCGHSFCRVCIEKCWENREEDCDCPICREFFPQKPKLKKNVTIAYMVDNIGNVKKGIRCTEHGKPIQLYCKDDESLMCLMCMSGEHQNHRVVAVEIAHAELKDVLAAKYPHVSQSMESVASQLQQVQKEKEQTEGSKDLLKRLETISDFKSAKRTPLPVLDFSKEENNLDGLIMLNNNFLEKIQKGPVEHPVKVELDRNNMRRLYGRSPSLDPNSAHRRIKISRDLRTATPTGTENQYRKHPDRFDVCPQVVSRDCFSSGRHYWEVDVGSSRWCGIGICLNSMGRKGGKSLLGENPESWCLEKRNNEFSALHNKQRTSLSVPGDPERFGFFLDCEAGDLTCFGDSRVLHVFRGNFMVPVKPAIRVYCGSVHFVHLVKSTFITN